MIKSALDTYISYSIASVDMFANKMFRHYKVHIYSLVYV